MHRCQKKRAKELEKDEKVDAASRPAHVQATTVNKRLLLTQEMLDSVDDEDGGAGPSACWINVGG